MGFEFGGTFANKAREFILADDIAVDLGDDLIDN